MLINRVSEVNDRGEVNENDDDQAQEYQTASELFEIMSRDHQIRVTDTITPSDLVLLYKNLDVGANLVSECNITTKRPNQRVETVVFEDDHDSDSDISEIYNTDHANVYDYNQERLDILNNEGSMANSLCQKLGGIEIQTSNLNNGYHQQFNIFQDSIKDQLHYNLGFQDFDGAVLPATLLDYICCKRLEDNYNFYMDNIIRYVKHTIEQLKRISNGDYLTEKAKEKWQEVTDPVDQNNNTKILASSTSIPLHIERKTSKHVSAWDDIVHSEVDVRSLSKILEKKIVVEVPKLICGTYKLFSRRFADNLIISCKRENNPIIEEENEESRVDVVLQLEKSQSGHIVSNISSVMILKTQQEIGVRNSLPLSYKDAEDSFFDATEDNSTSKVQIVEIKHEDEDCSNLTTNTNEEDVSEVKDLNDEDSCSNMPNNGCLVSNSENLLSNNLNSMESTESNDAFKDVDHSQRSRSESSFDVAPSSELKFAMQRFTMPSSLLEESVDDASQSTLNKKKCTTRVRIKSPYENQSHILEEKKRRRLLEIREKRERKKLALGENCKISKHKYIRGGIMPQASSSVTKLSITNKSFYNSIYGQTVANDQHKAKNRKGGKNDAIPEVPLDHEGEHDAPVMTPDSPKYINSSYYLDDAETEMMYLQTKQNDSGEIKACSASTSAESSDFRANFTLLSQLIGRSATDVNAHLNQDTSEEATMSPDGKSVVDVKVGEVPMVVVNTKSIMNFTPTNTPKIEVTEETNDPKKTSSTVECRKSIDKIYDLMKKLEKGEGDESDQPKTKPTSVHTDRINSIGRRVSSTIQGSDSGTSLKHHLTSSNPSCFSFEKTNPEIPKQQVANKKPEIPVAPKVIISNKVHIIKADGERLKKAKRPVKSPKHATQDNPLKAISQLLHEFDNVQKCRQKTSDSKTNKRHEATPTDAKNNYHQSTSSMRRSRLELHLKETEVADKIPKVTSPQKLKTSLGFMRNTRPQALIEENHDKASKRRIIDIIDEAKEARGEAVKGPSKFNSRLNSLAQPKKSYVQARIEEYPARITKPLGERQQKVTVAPVQYERNLGSANSRSKVKKSGTEAVSSVSVKRPPVQPIVLDKAVKKRRSANSSPEDASKPSSPVSTSKRNNVPPTPETLKKMVTVESYVKKQYRRAPPTAPPRDRPLAAGLKSRIPLLPKDIELASVTSANTAEESSEVGSKLHDMISTMIDVAPDLTVPSEKFEITRKKADNLPITEDFSRGDERASIDSDYAVDVFEDKHIETAVERINRATSDVGTEEDSLVVKSVTEIEKLESALNRKWPIGSFQKRLRIKNLTLTPKHSMKQVVVVQSGDGSLVIKSSLSKSLNLEPTNDIEDLKALPVLSKTELDWNFTGFPMQISTVGYAFPQCTSPFEHNNKMKSIGDVRKTTKPLNDALQTNEHIALLVEQRKQIIENILETEENTDESSINALRVKADEGKINLIHSFVDAVKSYEKADTVPPRVPDLNTEPLQKRNSKNIDYTTSLDMLMGLLNEIQKITSCQTNITNSDANDQHCKELEVILDDAAALEVLSNNPKELVSIASLDKMRKLESHTSMYTIYLSSDEENDNHSNNVARTTTANICQPLYVDKEVNVEIDVPKYINRFTDVPSIFPLNINHGTSVTNSLIGILSQPSSHSVLSFMEYQTVYSNSSFKTYKKVIQLPQQTKDEKIVGTTNKHSIDVCKEKEKLNEKLDVDSFKLALPCKEIGKRVNRKLIRCKKIEKIVKKESRVPDFDPLLKMKRDILVTVYSILVITVFAALSFPEVLYNV